MDAIDRAVRQLEKILHQDGGQAIGRLRGIIEEQKQQPTFNPRRVLSEINKLENRAALTVADVEQLCQRILMEAMP